ncbi:hypothetical protein KY290_027962 [Solanum tuberosum]|uniref:DUF4283 domain-containing protein n=1 Tax=Solanum tuberosum TaxID=4113 RepID=A0ABQ7UGH5_SOLTU|nr:hypothetical protein KY285_026932 [Solanum tuberosum]KAH0748730.1 hypothetical protein KY290_027962 [Solanum tuberosum]
MATAAVGQPPPVEVALTPQGVINNLGHPSTTSYANTIKRKSPPHKPVPMKQIAYLHGEPRIVWEDEEVDTTKLNKTRPSCARVKVEVDLMGDFLNRINVGVRKRTWEITEKWIAINYDYVPKYCKSCKLQGHNEKECFIIHPELYPKEDEKEVEKIEKRESTRGEPKQGESNAFTEQRRKNGNGRGSFPNKGGKRAQVWNPKNNQARDQNIETNNKYEALEEEKDEDEVISSGVTDKTSIDKLSRPEPTPWTWMALENHCWL